MADAECYPELNLSQEAIACLAEVGSCCTWHIHYSSEGLAIDISGMPVILVHEEITHRYATCIDDLSAAIIYAAAEWRSESDRLSRLTSERKHNG